MDITHRMDIAHRIIYQDDYVLAIDKPAGIIIHGDGARQTSAFYANNSSLTLTDHLRSYLESEGYADQARDLQALHRLDRDTTGIVLFSLDKKTQPAFDALLAGRDLHKHYLAVVKGEFPEGERDIDLPLGWDRHNAQKMRVSKTGKPALTHVSRLEVKRQGHKKLSLMTVELGTGRRHQIRVHFSALGFPIVGDDLYGRASARAPLMLHAYELSFIHPVTSKALVLKTEWPSRFAGWGVQDGQSSVILKA